MSQKHGVSIACVRPAVVFGHGRKRGSVLWAEAFATEPALGRDREAAVFPAFARHLDLQGRLRRATRPPRLKPSLAHFAYNNGGASVTAEEIAAAVRHWLPEAGSNSTKRSRRTPLIDWQDGARLETEIGFTPRPLVDGVRAHINEARKEAGLEPV